MRSFDAGIRAAESLAAAAKSHSPRRAPRAQRSFLGLAVSNHPGEKGLASAASAFSGLPRRSAKREGRVNVFWRRCRRKFHPVASSNPPLIPPCRP